MAQPMYMMESSCGCKIREWDNEESKCMTNYYIMVSVLNEHADTHWLGCGHSHD